MTNNEWLKKLNELALNNMPVEYAAPCDIDELIEQNITPETWFFDNHPECKYPAYSDEYKMIKLKLLADVMDRIAEDANAHDFVFSHRALAVLLLKTAGLSPALDVFTQLRAENGLHGLTGVCGIEPGDGALGIEPSRRNILSRNGISENWEEWKVPARNEIDNPGGTRIMATEYEWLSYFYENAYFGPADEDVIDMHKSSFMEETGMDMPVGYSEE